MRPLFIVALTAAALLSSAAGLRAQPPPRAYRRPSVRARAPRIVAANVLDAMYFKERAESDISPTALAAYGNRLVARRGFDHMFDACAVMEADKNPRPVPGEAAETKAFAYSLRRVGGGRVGFRLITDVYGGQGAGGCGGCFFEVPALRVTRREMLIVSEGRRYRLERPPGFRLGEASLVDDSLKKVLRTWQLPYQTTPLGLSRDRTRLYVSLPDFEDEGWDDKLALELSAAGVRFVARSGLKLPQGKPFVLAPHTDALFTEFGEGPHRYVLRVHDPCPDA